MKSSADDTKEHNFTVEGERNRGGREYFCDIFGANF